MMSNFNGWKILTFMGIMTCRADDYYVIQVYGPIAALAGAEYLKFNRYNFHESVSLALMISRDIFGIFVSRARHC